MSDSGLIKFSTSLFSVQELNYYNFLLNKSEFNNGLDLRNRYFHETQNIDESQSKHDYIVFLKVIILIVIKIN